mgnify:CR=1 FL=1
MNIANQHSYQSMRQTANKFNRKNPWRLLPGVIAVSCLLGFAEDLSAVEKSGMVKEKTFIDGWNEGKIEAVYLINPHLNNFTIDADVHGDHVVLKGRVKDGVDKELAEAIALGVDGIKSVDNQLVLAPDVKPNTPTEDEITFAQRIKDASTTAKIKTDLLASKYIEGMAINVNTRKGVVTLIGEVKSQEAKDLAMQLALNTEGVERVQSELKVANEKAMKKK